ncbi:RlpA-like double-psi beta-barrel-protein domain-containing protein-containing protein, partial [Zopfochytrium polystomum]
MTYFNTEAGLGSCGIQSKNSDYIVAMNYPMYKKSDCFTQICISYGGKSITATIVDLCPGCPYGGLDATDSLFLQFRPLEVGVFTMSWDY